MGSWSPALSPIICLSAIAKAMRESLSSIACEKDIPDHVGCDQPARLRFGDAGSGEKSGADRKGGDETPDQCQHPQ